MPQSGAKTDHGFKPNRNNQVDSIGIYLQDVVSLGAFSMLAGMRYNQFPTKKTSYQQDIHTIESNELR